MISGLRGQLPFGRPVGGRAATFAAFPLAATRAKDRLLITYASERGGRPTGGPSRFLAEAGLAGGTDSLAA